MGTQSHQSDPRILRRRTLQRDHRCLARLLRPGLSVLDLGCGTGSISAGAAKATGPHGYVLGIDRDEALLELARAEHGSVPNLRFEQGDATALTFRAQFDIVTAARTLQWIAEPARAIAVMKQAAKPGGMLLVLDYNHSRNGWTPEPPGEVRLFYSSFLEWRRSNGWDNEIADHLPELFRSAGLAEIASEAQDEITERGDAEFDELTALWPEVIERLGGQIAAAGFCTEGQAVRARERYTEWATTELVRQTLVMRAVTGIVP